MSYLPFHYVPAILHCSWWLLHYIDRTCGPVAVSSLVAGCLLIWRVKKRDRCCALAVPPLSFQSGRTRRTRRTRRNREQLRPPSQTRPFARCRRIAPPPSSGLQLNRLTLRRAVRERLPAATGPEGDTSCPNLLKKHRRFRWNCETPCVVCAKSARIQTVEITDSLRNLSKNLSTI